MIKSRRLRLLALVAALLPAACAGPQVAYNEHADFSKIHRIAVNTFSGPNGSVAADDMAQDLLALGADVVERQQLDAVLNEQHLSSSGILDPDTIHQVGKILGVDAIVVGTVSSYSGGSSYLVTGAQHSLVGTVTPISGNGDVYSSGQALGVPGSEVVTSAASVGVVARMIDVETGSMLWSARMNYDGFDGDSAMEEVTASLAKSLVPIWPELHPLK